MATSAFVQDFFPTSSTLLRRHAPSAWDAVFGYSQQHCQPTVAVLPLLGRTTIHNPSLPPLALLGALAGFHAAACTASSPKLVLWRQAFLCFAAMNVSAVACHSLLPQGTSLHAFAKALDVAFTGASSVSFILASVWRDLPAAVLQRRSGVLAKWLLAGGAICILANCLPHSSPWPMVNELAYIATTLAAAVVLALREVVRPGLSSSRRFWVVAAGISAAIAAQGVLLDAALCKYYGAWFSSTHLLFLCCDIAIYGLGQYVWLGRRAGVSKAAAKTPSTPQRHQPARRAKAAAMAAIASP